MTKPASVVVAKDLRIWPNTTMTTKHCKAAGWLLLACFGASGALACSVDCSERSNVYAGSLYITGPGTEFDPDTDELECIQVVTGDLTFADTSATSLDSLSSVVHVLGDVKIAPLATSYGSLSLRSLAGLNNLRDIGGSLTLYDAPKLKTVDDLGGLEYLGGDLTLSKLPAVRSLAGLKLPQQLYGSFTISHLDSLATLDDFITTPTSVSGDVNVDYNRKLLTLWSSAFLTIEGSLRIQENDKLTAVEHLDSANGDVTIRGNADLATISFGHVGSYFPGEADIRDNPKLVSIDFADAALYGGLNVVGNESLKELTGVRGQAGGLTNCGSAEFFWGPMVTIADNAQLEKIELREFTQASLHISSNPRLTEISGDKYVRTCDTSLSRLDALTELDLTKWRTQDLSISKTGLVTLSSLAEADIECSLDISDNPQLLTIGKKAPGAVSAGFRVEKNRKLASCEVEAIADALPEAPGACLQGGFLSSGMRGVNISGNDDAAECE